MWDSLCTQSVARPSKSTRLTQALGTSLVLYDTIPLQRILERLRPKVDAVSGDESGNVHVSGPVRDWLGISLPLPQPAG